MNKRSKPLRPGMVRVDLDVAMRAVAILSVVWNHANPLAMGELGGGMTFLMMLSGYNFARFSIRGATPAATRAALVKLGIRIGVPSLLLVLFFFVVLNRFDWKELLFVSNWWTVDRISVFPTWYPQVMLQMFLLLWLLFSIPAARYALSHPLGFSLAIFLIGVVLRLALPALVWDTGYLHHNLPHLYLWNFTLGWVVFFLVGEAPRRWGAVVAAVLCIALGSYAGWGLHRLDFWWLVAGGALFACVRTMPMPKPLATVVGLISQSAFVIFLLHRFSFVVLNHIVPSWEQREAVPHFLFAVIVSLSVWVFMTAFGRTWRQLRPVARRAGATS